jgi:hypothetical protein
MRCVLVIAVALVSWCPPGWTQRPSDEDSSALIERSREKAREYAQSLPDFVTTEVIHRYTGSEAISGFWSPINTLTIQLRYSQHQEDHKLTLVDGKPTRQTFETLEGTVGSGEFGTTLSAVFEPASQTSFHWQRWKNVRKRRAAVFEYVVNGPHSRYRLGTQADGRTVEANVGYHGVVEIDAETAEILHLEYLADHIPETLHLRYAGTTVDYALADIGGRDYLLPAYSETEMRSPVEWVKNIAAFRDYHKFAADSTVDFGPPK